MGKTKKTQELIEPLEKPESLITFDAGDPFIAGAMRSCGIVAKVPYAVERSNEQAEKLLSNYILRASGGGRKDLAAAAQKAFNKLCRK